MAGTTSHELVQVVALLGAGVAAVPIFKRLGLGSVLGYLTAGLLIGPYGVGLFNDPQGILHVAELGVVMFLFIIGLEMQPSRLWSLRREIFGLGAAQVLLGGLALTMIGVAAGFSSIVSFVAGMGFVLTSTATAMQLLEERGEASTPAGQRIVSILLLEDLAIVPLLALVAFVAPGAEETSISNRLPQIAIGLGAIVALTLAGRYLLNPMFRALASSSAREVMTAAALLVVLGAALIMQVGGLSMAMGAFLAGVLLSESTFRHQLEADIEPFRGILLGLFFMSVGMSLDLAVIARQWPMITATVIVYMTAKGAVIYSVARLLKAPNSEALIRAGLMAQGGEFAFVLYSGALAVGILDKEMNAMLTTTVIISMALTPLVVATLDRLIPTETQSLDGIDVAKDLSGGVLMIGFGRFGQIASQPLLLRGVEVSIIDNDVEMIQAAANFGFKVYYGDGTRLDILHAAGAGRHETILICVDKGETALRIAELLQTEFPLVRVLARAYDRGIALDLVHQGVDFQIRETFESALAIGSKTLATMNVPREEVEAIIEDVRMRDKARFDMELTGGLAAGRSMLKGNQPTPTPLATPRKPGRIMNNGPHPTSSQR